MDDPLQYHCSYKIHDIKYISDVGRLEAQTVANEIGPTLVSDQVHIIYPQLHVLGQEDQNGKRTTLDNIERDGYASNFFQILQKFKMFYK